jgi:hypothetical protein
LGRETLDLLSGHIGVEFDGDPVARIEMGAMADALVLRAQHLGQTRITFENDVFVAAERKHGEHLAHDLKHQAKRRRTSGRHSEVSSGNCAVRRHSAQPSSATPIPAKAIAIFSPK